MLRLGGRLLEVVVYERFQYEAVTENIFAVFGRQLPTGGLTVLKDAQLQRRKRSSAVHIPQMCVIQSNRPEARPMQPMMDPI